jgi:hypothetical protein
LIMLEFKATIIYRHLIYRKYIIVYKVLIMLEFKATIIYIHLIYRLLLLSKMVVKKGR